MTKRVVTKPGMHVIQLRNVPDVLHRKLKTLAKARGTNMRFVCLEAIRREIKEAEEGEEI